MRPTAHGSADGGRRAERDESREAVRFLASVEAAALYMATEPQSVRRAVVTHHPGERGCAGCGPSVSWPCVVAYSARRAEELLAEAALARASVRPLPRPRIPPSPRAAGA